MSHCLIVGAGVFGLSTAYHLLLDGEKHITIIDRSSTLPAPDAASVDINRIVRSSYREPLYAGLGRDAIESWKRDFPGIYRESGLLVLGSADYVAASQANDLAIGATVIPVPDAGAIRSVMPSHIPIGAILSSHLAGYITPNGGWADAEAGLRSLLAKVQTLGGRVFGGKEAESLLFEPATSQVVGVRVRGGEEITADVVVVATGSWTPSTFPDPKLGLVGRLTATGQSVACIQLTTQEAERYKDIPVMFNIDTGFYIFPPNPDGLMKVAIHGGGYMHYDSGVIQPSGTPSVSTPRTITSHGEAGLAIPAEMAGQLKEQLKALYPELDRSFCKTRLCWYSDTRDGDWLIDEHPDHKGLFFATGGSGHAYKFLPVLGKLVVQRMRNALDASTAATFAFDRAFDAKPDHSRPGREIGVLDKSIRLITAGNE